MGRCGDGILPKRVTAQVTSRIVYLFERGEKREMPNGPDGMKKVPSKKIAPKPPRFNIMWLWIAMILGFFALQFLFTGDKPKRITYNEFETDILNTGDVDKLVAYNRNNIVYAEVYIKKDRLSDPKYADVRPTSNNLALAPSTAPQYEFTDGSFETLERKLEEAQVDTPQEERVFIR